MQINFRLLSVITLATFTTFTACKKDSKPTDSSTELATHADDQNQVSNQMDIVASEASLAIESSSSLSGARVQNPPFAVCDATLTLDTTSTTRTATITYAGTSCSGSYKRTGTVLVSMPANVQWKNAGATITVTYQNFKVTRLSDNKSVTINGSHTITNVSGGLLFNLPYTQTPITHIVNSSGMALTFDDGSQRTWQVATRRVFTFSNNAIVLTITGNNSNGTTEGIAEWGTNRFGHEFMTTITQPLIIRSDCSFRLTAGEVKHQGFGTATATFGLDVSGNPTSCPGTGHYYFKLTWTGPNGASASAILPY